MPLYSCFTPFGHLTYSSDLSHGEKFYNSIVNSLGGEANYSLAVGSRSEARIYARAMLYARARYAKERAANQMNPRTVVEMLPVREKMFGLVPSRHATIPERQDALAKKYLLPQGAKYTAVVNALIAILGTDFLYYYVTKRADIGTFPSSPGSGPGKFSDFRIPSKIVRLTSGISVLGSPQPVAYEPVDANAASVIEVGDVVVMSPNNIGIAERVVVTAASLGTFTATFTKVHDDGDIATTGYFPYWTSTQNTVLVIVKPAAAADPEKKRKVHELMAEISRGWVTWQICPSSNGTSTDSFTVGNATLGRVGYAGIGSVSFP